MFEIHITVNALQGAEIDQFVDFCKSKDAKAIVIELDKGEILQQPMTSKIYKDVEEGSLKSKNQDLTVDFGKSGYSIKRIKVEVPLNYRKNGIKEFPNYKGQYFEWHGKVQVDDLDFLKESLKYSNAHISRNSLKGQKNRRFVSFRYPGAGSGSQNTFISCVKDIISKLAHKNIKLYKEEYEFCIFDSNKSIDKGWIDTPEITDQSYLELLAFEGFLRRASRQAGKFILKGSLLTRQCIAEKHRRSARDLDFLYGESLDSADEAERIFSNWVIQITEEDADDQIRFTSFKENQFWRGVDYAMDDDFPTTNTDISCHVKTYELPDLGLDISWNLPLEEEVVPILYQPIEGEPFELKYTVPVSIQIAWKLHQCIVRPRAKDIIDVIWLLNDNNLAEDEIKKVINSLTKECEKDRIDPSRILCYCEGALIAFVKKNEAEFESNLNSFGYISLSTPFGFDLGNEMKVTYLDQTFDLENPYANVFELLEDFEETLKKYNLAELFKKWKRDASN